MQLSKNRVQQIINSSNLLAFFIKLTLLIMYTYVCMYVVIYKKISKVYLKLKCKYLPTYVEIGSFLCIYNFNNMHTYVKSHKLKVLLKVNVASDEDMVRQFLIERKISYIILLHNILYIVSVHVLFFY